MTDTISKERVAELIHWCAMTADDRCAETLRALIDERARLLALVVACEAYLDDGNMDGTITRIEDALDAWKAGR